MAMPSYKLTHPVFIAASLIAFINVAVSLTFSVIDFDSQGISEIVILLVFWGPLAYFGYKIWIDWRFSSIPLAILLLIHGLITLLGAGLAGSILYLILSVSNFLVSVTLIMFYGRKKQDLENK